MLLIKLTRVNNINNSIITNNNKKLWKMKLIKFTILVLILTYVVSELSSSKECGGVTCTSTKPKCCPQIGIAGAPGFCCTGRKFREMSESSLCGGIECPSNRPSCCPNSVRGGPGVCCSGRKFRMLESVGFENTGCGTCPSNKPVCCPNTTVRGGPGYCCSGK